jgi:Asp-tRNA(Asn)/Glu-tRNA(Gln) amidotransferase C subunit
MQIDPKELKRLEEEEQKPGKMKCLNKKLDSIISNSEQYACCETKRREPRHAKQFANNRMRKGQTRKHT